MANETPRAPGFYWAKWTSARFGTPLGQVIGDQEWVVVQVFENAGEADEDYLLVFVPGSEHPQALSNFIWGLGPLNRISQST